MRFHIYRQNEIIVDGHVFEVERQHEPPVFMSSRFNRGSAVGRPRRGRPGGHSEQAYSDLQKHIRRIRTSHAKDVLLPRFRRPWHGLPTTGIDRVMSQETRAGHEHMAVFEEILIPRLGPAPRSAARAVSALRADIPSCAGGAKAGAGSQGALVRASAWEPASGFPSSRLK